MATQSQEYLLKTPVPVPTPYQPMQYGGNPHIAPGTQGPMVGTYDRPVASSGGYTQFSNGVVYPNNQTQNTPTNLPTITTSYSSSPNGTVRVANPVSQSGYGAMTESEALRLGYDVNQLRRDGKLVENKPAENKPSIGDVAYDTRAASDWRRAALRAGKDVNSPEFADLRRREDELLRPQREAEAALKAQEADRQAGIRNTINSGFDRVLGGYNDMSSGIPLQQQEDEQTVGHNYNLQNEGINTDFQNQIKMLNTYKDDVMNRKKISLNELAANMKQMLTAGNTMLGGYGAGDSSAVEMLKYALAKQSDKSAVGLQNQVNTQLSELDRKAVEVEGAKAKAVQELSLWRNDALDKIRQNARSQLSSIQQAKIGADQGRMQALVGLETSILNQVTAQLQQIEAENRQNSRNIDQWARERIASLQDYKLKISQSGSFSPQELTTQAIQGLNAGQFQGAGVGEGFYNPYALEKKKQFK